MDLLSDNSKKGFSAQAYVWLKLRTSLSGLFEVLESRSYFYGKEGSESWKLNALEKESGDIIIVKQNIFVAEIEVCSGSSHGVSIGKSKEERFEGSHFCFVLPTEDNPFGIVIFAPRDRMSRYLSAVNPKESKDPRKEDYKWLSAENILGLHCGMDLQNFLKEVTV